MAEPPRRILLTGASGFVGSHLAPLLRTRYPGASLVVQRVELTDRNAVETLLDAVRPDICVHLAALSTVRAAREREEEAWAVNLTGTLTLARALRRHAPEATMLFASSAEVYGASFRDGVPITEASLPAPLHGYGATKAAADLALGAMAEEGPRVIRLRPFNHTGPGQTADFVVPAFARHVARIAAGLQPPVMTVGNLDVARDFLDVRDVCACYLACIDHRHDIPSGTILNVASGQPRRIRDILTGLLDLAGISAEIRVDPALLRASDVPVTRGDASRAAALAGWRPAIAWETTLRDVLDDWRRRVTRPDA